MTLKEATTILRKNGYLVEFLLSGYYPHYDEIDVDREVEKAINYCYDFEDSRSYGPNNAYRIALNRASRLYPDFNFPSNRAEFEEIYGYDIDDPPDEVTERLFNEN